MTPKGLGAPQLRLGRAVLVSHEVGGRETGGRSRQTHIFNYFVVLLPRLEGVCSVGPDYF